MTTTVIVWLSALVVVLIALVGILVYKYNDARNTSNRLMNRAKDAENALDDLYQKTWKFLHPDND